MIKVLEMTLLDSTEVVISGYSFCQFFWLSVAGGQTASCKYGMGLNTFLQQQADFFGDVHSLAPTKNVHTF